MASNARILLVLSDNDTSYLIERNILSPEGYQVSVAHSCAEGDKLLKAARPDLMILGDNLQDGDHLEYAAKVLEKQPTLPIILFTKSRSETLPLKVVRLGLVDWLTPPLRPDDVLQAVTRGLERRKVWSQWLQVEAKRYTGQLQQKVDELETLAKVGRSINAQLDLDRVLTIVVQAAVELTGAEESSILLLDEESGELYMRAARNFQDEFVRTFRLPVEDTLAGQVLETGEPVFINKNSPQKIKTAYLVLSLLYVPLKIHDRTIGVLGVDNRERGGPFDDHHRVLVSTLADYAAIAIENATLYTESEVERNKFESILTKIHDGVIVFDQEGRLLMVNPAVKRAFGLGEGDQTGKPLEQVFKHEELLKILQGEVLDPYGVEIEAQNGRVYNAQLAIVPEVGTVATLRDITYLKELDRVKSDFVTVVSHDLRSPLTAILGYVELLSRTGELNEQQAEFTYRIQHSVRGITDLINRLLDLGRAEVGLDEEIEPVTLVALVRNAVDEIQTAVREKGLSLTLDLASGVPALQGNNLQLQQMVDNLLNNAVKYTPKGGEIRVSVKQEQEQIILQVADSGIGIPPAEQNRIFEKFFRATNAPQGSQGTGLGLAIVKSIVDNHGGRIWVESSPGSGSTFTVVLPIREDVKSNAEVLS